MKTQKLDQRQRRQAILEAVVPVFAAKGFYGVRTRELAAAAGVSEALLYRHFPSKEDLYAALLDHVRRAHDRTGDQSVFAGMKPSTRKLVWGVRRLVEHMVQPPVANDAILPRLMAHSLLGDGAFARDMLAIFQRDVFADLGDALEAARHAGDVLDTRDAPADAVWWIHHLVFGLRILSLPDDPVVSHAASVEERAVSITRFLLRGLGMRPEIIQRELTPDPGASG
jgi:AcrR family transcriptional regulator